MHQVGKMKAAGAHNLFDNNDLRIYQCPTGNDDQGHKEIEYCEIRDFLKRVELPAAVDRVWSFFAFKNPEQVITCLGWNFFFKPAPSHTVVKSIMGEQVTKKNHHII